MPEQGVVGVIEVQRVGEHTIGQTGELRAAVATAEDTCDRSRALVNDIVEDGASHSKSAPGQRYTDEIGDRLTRLLQPHRGCHRPGCR
jgi:hypothetical protein